MFAFPEKNKKRKNKTQTMAIKSSIELYNEPSGFYKVINKIKKIFTKN